MNNERDMEPGPFSINVSQVTQLSSRSVLTFHFTFNSASQDALYDTFYRGNLVLVAVKLK